MAEWHTVETARDQWIDAPLDDVVLTELLAIAKQQVAAYAPSGVFPGVITEGSGHEGAYGEAIWDGILVPDNFRYGQLRQAQNLYNAGRVNANGSLGDGNDFVMTPHPLDWHIKQILRPRRAVPRVG